MKIEEALSGVRLMFLDTAPIIYAVERDPNFIDFVDPIFDRLDLDITSVISPITLAECLVGPKNLGLVDLEQTYLQLLTREDVVFVGSNLSIAQAAAQVRSHYQFQLADSFQIATALESGCDAFLTNDKQLKRMDGLKIIVIDELEIGSIRTDKDDKSSA
jgi:predicted nucleic acid-binding protein